MKVHLTGLALSLFFSVNAFSSLETIDGVKVDFHAEIGKTVVSTKLIKDTKNHQFPVTFKLVGIFDSMGNLFDQHLYVTTNFSDWAYLEKGVSHGNKLDVTKIKKDLNCKINPCVYSETVAIRFENLDQIKSLAQTNGAYKFKLMGKHQTREYFFEREYFRNFVRALEQSRQNLELKAQRQTDTIT